MQAVVLQFAGGCWDARQLRSDSADPGESKLARLYFRLSRSGAVNEHVSVDPSDASAQSQEGGNIYRVVARTENDGKVQVRFAVVESDGDGRERQPKRVIIIFEDGCLEGIRMDSRSADSREALLAISYYGAAENGLRPALVNGINAAHWAERTQGKPIKHRCHKGVCQYEVSKRTDSPGTVVLNLTSKPSTETSGDRG
jgi:hypothetical protein